MSRVGILASREQGNKTVFYEESVIKYFATQPAWKAVLAGAKPSSAKPVSDESVPVEIATEGQQRVDISVASVMLNRSAGAIYQLTSNNRIPHHKEGKKVYFFTDELKEWAQSNPPRKRKKE